jgi:cytochrome c
MRTNKVNILLPVSFLLVALFLLPACGDLSNEPADGLPLTLARRSVLDQQVRMLTLRFGEDRFAAYHLGDAQLRKVWRGGVLWNGAVFNNIKTVQPESYGNSYWQSEEHPLVWTLETNGRSETVQLEYRSYTLEDDGITFRYEISGGQEEPITIYEKPAFLLVNDQPSYRREFRCTNLGEQQVLYLGDQMLKNEQTTTVLLPFEHLPPASPPELAVSSDNSQYWLDRSGCSTCHDEHERKVGPSYEAIASRYEPGKASVELLTQSIKNGSSGKWGTAAMIPHPDLAVADIERMVQYILSLRPKEQKTAIARPAVEEIVAAPSIPGFGAALMEVHPAFTLQTIRPAKFKPRVGGMAFLPDGRLLVSTWDSIGGVYALEGVVSGDTQQVRVQQIATGLSEPLGLTTVGDEIFVMQKHELTQLIDHDQDGVTDEYLSVNHSFGATPDFHEFSYGLVHQDGYFYGGLGLAMRLMSHEEQLPDRGTIFKAGRDGSFELIADGLRQPNGIGVAIDNEIFLTENQGQWVPACKLIHLQPGSFYGCEFGTSQRHTGREAVPPAVWLPQDEIGNSPSEPLPLNLGPYQGQLIYGEVTHGGIKRVFLEKVNGAYQGCVFRFMQGLEAGINRMAWGPDGGLYVGGVGMNGGWSHQGRQYGLQKLVFNENIPFEILAMRAEPGGFEIEFTKAIGMEPEDLRKLIAFQQWYYEATPRYGGPKLGQEDLKLAGLSLSEDGRRIHVQVPDLKTGHVIYLNISPDLRSKAGERLWSGEAWYTLNNIIDN